MPLATQVPHSAVSAAYSAAGRSLRLRIVRHAMTIVLFVFLTAVASQVKVPLPNSPVPMTVQLVPVLLAGFILAPKLAALSMVGYVMAGSIGLPVFANPAGLAGLTGGYLLGFVACAWLVAMILGISGRSMAALLAAGLLGLAVLFGCGLSWLALGYVGFPEALRLGLYPFVVKALVELCFAAAIVKTWIRFRPLSLKGE